MFDTITIALFVLAVLSLIAAVVAIGWLFTVSKHLSALGRRVLDSEDIGRIIEAADKIASYESRMAGCETKADKSQNQLVKHETKLSELAAKLVRVEQVTHGHTADLAMASENMASSELRFDRFENNVDEKLNQLPEHETKLNELADKLESVEQTANKNEDSLTEADRSIMALGEAIQNLTKFQTATEKANSLILAAFTDLRTSMPPEGELVTTPETPKPEESSQWPQDQQEETEDEKTEEAEFQKSSETYL